MRVSRIQVLKGAFSPILNEAGVYIPRDMIFPRQPFLVLRRDSSNNVHQSVNKAVMATNLETVNLTTDQRNAWLEQRERWLISALKTGEERFQLHLDEELNKVAIERASSFKLPTNTYIIYATAPVQ